MALEITSVGAKVYYAIESTASTTHPVSGWTELIDVNSAPEQDLSVETIDVSNITDTVTRYAPGRQDPGADQVYQLNHTDAVISAWSGMVASAEAAATSGLKLWFQYWFPNATNSYYWAGTPLKLGTSGIEQNELDLIPAHVVLTAWEGWASASTAS